MQQLKNWPKAVEAYDRAASAEERLGSQWHAAKHYEIAAELSIKMENYKEAARFYKASANLFVEAGKHTTGEALACASAVPAPWHICMARMHGLG